MMLSGYCSFSRDRVVKGAVFQILWGLAARVRIQSSELLPTSQQPTQLSILSRSVNESSEVTLMAQAIVPQAHISCIAATCPACVI